MVSQIDGMQRVAPSPVPDINKPIVFHDVVAGVNKPKGRCAEFGVVGVKLSDVAKNHSLYSVITQVTAWIFSVSFKRHRSKVVGDFQVCKPKLSSVLVLRFQYEPSAAIFLAVKNRAFCAGACALHHKVSSCRGPADGHTLLDVTAGENLNGYSVRAFLHVTIGDIERPLK